jgi:2-dehydro-3-deoxyglucarate aldolase/4-hydroxy-2-oxoheptanedioate aldolase
MRENRAKRVLREGGVPLGSMVFEFNTSGLARIAAAAGADFLIYDMEHTGWSMETIRMLMASSRAADLAPFVRVPALEYHFIARALDVGALGIMVPMLETEEQAREFVACVKYPPQGRRGAAFAVAHDDYRDGDVASKMRSANEETLLIALLETRRGVENAERIAAVEGIDVLWIGHFDLSNSMGIPAQFQHPDLQAAIDRILAAARKHGKACGFMAASPEEGRALIDRGFGILCYWGDIWIYRETLARGIAGIRESLTVRPPRGR